MKRRRSKSFFNIGITSVVLIFVMLCLLTFAVLSFVSARSDLGLSQKSARRTTAYYKSYNNAVEILKEITACMSSQHDQSNETLYFKNIMEQLDGKNGISFSDERHLSYSVSMDSEQMLTVSLTLYFTPLENGNHYRINTWKTVSTHKWTSDNNLPVFNSENNSDMIKEK